MGVPYIDVGMEKCFENFITEVMKLLKEYGVEDTM